MIGKLDTSAFLNGTLNEDLNIIVPEGINEPKENVLKLNKAIYIPQRIPTLLEQFFYEFAHTKMFSTDRIIMYVYIFVKIFSLHYLLMIA